MSTVGLSPPMVADLGCWICRVLADAVEASAVDLAMYEGMIVGARIGLGAAPVLCPEHAARWDRVGMPASLANVFRTADRSRSGDDQPEPPICTCRGDLRGWNHLPTCPKYRGDVDDAKAEALEIGDCGFTERESAIKAFRQISELVEHDSPIHLLAVEEWSSLAHYVPCREAAQPDDEVARLTVENGQLHAIVAEIVDYCIGLCSWSPTATPSSGEAEDNHGNAYKGCAFCSFVKLTKGGD